MPLSRNRKKKRPKPNSSTNQPVRNMNHPAKVNTGGLPGQAKITQSYYQGAIPPPEMMRGYAEISPDLPNRIVTMAEKNADHRRLSERKVLNYSFATTTIGQMSGLLMVLASFGLSYLFMMAGHPDIGKSIACITAVSLAVIFVLRRIPSSNKNDTE